MKETLSDRIANLFEYRDSVGSIVIYAISILVLALGITQLITNP